METWECNLIFAGILSALCLVWILIGQIFAYREERDWFQQIRRQGHCVYAKIPISSIQVPEDGVRKKGDAVKLNMDVNAWRADNEFEERAHGIEVRAWQAQSEANQLKREAEKHKVADNFDVNLWLEELPAVDDLEE